MGWASVEEAPRMRTRTRTRTQAPSTRAQGWRMKGRGDQQGVDPAKAPIHFPIIVIMQLPTADVFHARSWANFHPPIMSFINAKCIRPQRLMGKSKHPYFTILKGWKQAFMLSGGSSKL